MDWNLLKGNPFYLNDRQLAWVEATLGSMSAEDKLRHLFCLVAYDDDDEACRKMAEEVRPGGVMSRVMPAKQCVSLVNKLQSKSKIPLLIAANLEAGGDGMAKEGTGFAKPLQIAATDDAENARRLGEVCGTEGTALGANWSFAPIVDIDTNWRNPITNTRTFGADPARVEQMGVAYVEALQKEGVAACMKHFPGDGRDERDQHVAVSINSCSVEEWDQTYGKIYSAGIAAGVKTVMVGHILQPAYTKYFSPQKTDGEMLPATLSYEIVTKLLREKLGFQGLVVTDSTAMAGLSVFLPREEIVPLTIAAGCDMFLFTKNLEEDLAFMKAGYERGVFDAARLDEAVTRILALKASLGLAEATAKDLQRDPDTATAALGNETYRAWSREVADRAITLVKEETGIFPITPKRFPRVLFYATENLGRAQLPTDNPANPNARFLQMLRDAGFEVTLFVPQKVTEGAQSSVNELKSKYDLIIYSMAKKPNYQVLTRIKWDEPQGASIPIYCHTIPTVFVSFENPYYLLDVPHMRTYINCYSDTRTTMEALLDKMMGKRPFCGVSPVDAFCGKWETRVSFGPSLELDKR